MAGTTITASTSVVLVDTTVGTSPYIVYFPYISTVGRIITVRDNNGYASTGNSIVLSTLANAYFPDNQSTLSINQPYGFISLSVNTDGYYSILNTFAFPTGSSSAYVYNLNTNTLGIQDQTTSAFNTLTTSTGSLYYNNTIVGDVTSIQLSNTIQNAIASEQIVRSYIAVGNSTTATIQFSDNLGSHWYNVPAGTQGFTNGGIDIVVNKNGEYIACGDNTGGDSLGFIQWSFDGKTWYTSTSPSLATNTIRSRVSYANGIWHAIGAGSYGQSILWSVDKVNWNPSITASIATDSTTLVYSGIAYNNSVWVCCGTGSNSEDPTCLVWSTNGSNWNKNPSIPIYLSVFSDIVYDGTNFITLVNNGTANNIYVSPTGSNNWNIIPESFNNETGFLAANPQIVIAVTPSYHKFSINNGNTWTTIPDFPPGIPSRPYYDGSIWWVGINGPNSNVYTSTTGSNNWTSSNIYTIFPGGYPTAFASINTSSNLNFQLISTVFGLEQTQYISSLRTDVISLNTFTIENNIDNNILNITSYVPNAVVYMNSISTNSIKTASISFEELSIIDLSVNNLIASTLQVSSINVDMISTDIIHGNYAVFPEISTSTVYGNYAVFSTIYSTDNINTLSFIGDTISTNIAYSSNFEGLELNIQEIQASTINSDNIFILNAEISTLSVSDTTYLNLVNADTISTNTAITSTLQLVDTDGSLRELYTASNKLYFQGSEITTNLTNPAYYSYTLFDLTGASPYSTQFSIYTNSNQSVNLRDVTQFIISTTDLTGVTTSGFFGKVGINCIINLVNPILATNHMYRIDSKTESGSGDTFLFKVTIISGSSETAVLDQVYNMFIVSIGITPPKTAPSNTITVKAKTIANGFDFTNRNVLATVPVYIGTYIPGSGSGSQFSINLNTNNYNVTNIPAVIGSIVYFTNSGYVILNVKCGSASTANGAYITLDSGVQTLTISGLNTTNFPGATNDLTNGFSLYITLQFLN